MIETELKNLDIDKLIAQISKEGIRSQRLSLITSEETEAVCRSAL